MGAMGLDGTLNIAHQACAKYSTLNKITHVNCAKAGDMEIAHVYVLEIAHHFSLCAYAMQHNYGGSAKLCSYLSNISNIQVNAS